MRTPNPMYPAPVERQRFMGGFSNPTLSYDMLWQSCVPVTNVPVAATVGVGETKSCKDYVIPMFKQRRANGEVFFNPVSLVKREQVLSSAFTAYELASKTGSSCSGITRYAGYRYNGNHCGQLANLTHGVSNATLPIRAVTDSDIGRAQKEAGTAAIANVGNTESNSDFLQTIAELQQLSSLVKDPMRQLSILITGMEKKARRTEKLNKTQRVEALAKLWITYRLAIRPLMVDIDTIISKMGSVSNERVRRTSRGFASLSGTSSLTRTRTTSNGTESCILSVTDDVKVRAMTLHEHTIHWGEHYGLTATNLASLPWNLVTLSFVADWFGNVGDVLAMGTPRPGYEHLGSCLTVKRETTNLYTVPPPVITDTTSNWTSLISGSFTVRETSYTRVSSLPFGFVTRANFRFDEITRLADAASLAFIMRARLTSLASVILLRK